MNSKPSYVLSVLRKYRRSLRISSFEFCAAPKNIKEETLVSLCYDGLLEGYWDTSETKTVFKVRFPEPEQDQKTVKERAKYDREKIKLLLLEGMENIDIAQEIGCSVRYVRDFKLKYGVKA